MILKESKELKELAARCGKPTSEVSDIIVSELIKNNLIQDSHENWGVYIFDAILEGISECNIINFVDSIRTKLKLDNIKFMAIVDFDLMGTGDCPECGGEMESIDGEYTQTGGNGYDTPPEYTPIWETKKCSNCGHEESDEPSY